MNAYNGRTAGMVIAVCAVLIVAALALHPSVGSAPFSAALLAEIVRLAPLDRAVHGALMVMLYALVFAMVIFSLRAGLHHPPVLLGLIAYIASTLFFTGAAVVDGFIIPDIASRYVSAPPQLLSGSHHLLVLCALAIQALTKFGVVAASTAILSWSLQLVRAAGAFRLTAALGIVAAVASLTLTAGVGQFTPHSIGATFLLQSVWLLAIAGLLISERL